MKVIAASKAATRTMDRIVTRDEDIDGRYTGD